MLTEAGSVASLVGVIVSLSGLGFAILQIWKLRGETRAAKEAAEAARQAIRRNLTITEITRLSERIQGLAELHRIGDRVRSLERYPEIRESFLEIRRQHTGLSEQHRESMMSAMYQIADMERRVESLEGAIPPELSVEFNSTLSTFQLTLLPELEDQLSGQT